MLNPRRVVAVTSVFLAINMTRNHVLPSADHDAWLWINQLSSPAQDGPLLQTTEEMQAVRGVRSSLF